MNDIPRIFSDEGALIEIDASKLDAPMRERYAAIVTAHAANQQAEQRLADANAEVRDALAAVRNTEDYYQARWPKQTFYELWRENFTGDDYAHSGEAIMAASNVAKARRALAHLEHIVATTTNRNRAARAELLAKIEGARRRLGALQRNHEKRQGNA